MSVIRSLDMQHTYLYVDISTTEMLQLNTLKGISLTCSQESVVQQQPYPCRCEGLHCYQPR